MIIHDYTYGMIVFIELSEFYLDIIIIFFFLGGGGGGGAWGLL